MNKIAAQWFALQQWKSHAFQKETWKHIAAGRSGLLNAPTGYGKTYAVWFGVLEDYFKRHTGKRPYGLHCLWITPLRALSKEIENATTRVSTQLDLPYRIGLRTGDTSASEKLKQKKNTPEALITTPESVHLMLAQKGYADVFRNLQFIVVDEWHELMGSKRGVQVELAISRLKAINPELKIWGISATIGNLEEAKEILLGQPNDGVLVKSSIQKKTEVITLLPDTLEKFPWAGHLGISMVHKVLDIIDRSQSALLFTNTRSQAEIWYRRLLDERPDLAGLLALHHGSLSEALRKWVEEALHAGTLKAVVCTSSLDLGVDFRPVDTVLQIGSAKGIARFMQRAGRSGHYPGAVSKIYFVPTHSLEIVEGAALRYALQHSMMERRIPFVRSFDVLIQYMVTLAISDGFHADELFAEIETTHCFQSVTRAEFNDCLLMITQGGKMLTAYDEFHKVVVTDGRYKVTDRAVATRHRLSMGTISSDTMMQVKFQSGKYIGSIEEWFISRLVPGNTFWFAGKTLELIQIKNLQAIVRPSHKKSGVVPSWMGGKMPLSTHLSIAIRHQLNEYKNGQRHTPEIQFLLPLFREQEYRSYLPDEDELLIEEIQTKEGYHLFVYPFEGKFVHEGMATVLAHRIAQIRPFSFSIAANDYGFELLTDEAMPIAEALENGLFSLHHLHADINASINTSELARRRFRDIAAIAGLIFTGYPGRQMKTKHLQANAQLFFNMYEEYEPDNLLLKEAYEEVFDFQLEIARMTAAFQRIGKQKIIWKRLDRPTPFSFPIFAERFREKYSNEDLETRIQKIKKSMGLI